jgi:CelD/BcsL family acetyltransferase involved in cellulose biosynthesis
VTTRLLSLAQLQPSDVERWRDLAARSAEANPFFEYELAAPAARHLGGDGVSLLVVEHGGDWTGCLPVQRSRIGGIAKSVVAWRHPYCFLGTPLIDRETVEPAVERLVATVRCERGVFLVLPWMLADGAVFAALRAAMGSLAAVTVTERGYERAAFRRGDDGSLPDPLSKSRRRDLRRRWRRLEEELGAPLEMTEIGGSDAGVREFLELEASGWKGERGTALASDPGHAAFFEEMCAGFAAQGRLVMRRLGTPDRAIAMTTSIAAGDTVFCFKMAFDESLRGYGPGVQLLAREIEGFGDRSERWLDSCASADNELVNSMMPDRRRITTLVVARRGPRATLSRQGARALQLLQGVFS